MGIDAAELESQPQIMPLLKQCSITTDRIMEVLRGDAQDESRAVVKTWDGLTPANRRLAGLEAVAMASGITPRRLWEVFNGANLMQSREAVGAMIADSLPAVIAVTIREAKKVKGYSEREHLYKAARVLPTPKGSVINIGTGGQPQAEGESLEDDDDPAGLLEPADDALMKYSRAMGKSLPAPKEPEVIDADVVDEESDDL